MSSSDPPCQRQRPKGLSVSALTCVSQFQLDPLDCTAVPRLPFVSDVVRAQLQWQNDSGNLMYSNIYLQYEGGPPNASEALGLAEAIFTAAEQFVGDCHTTVVLVGVRVTDLSADDTGDALHAGVSTGTLEGGDLPSSTSALLNFTIGRRYRGGKPRNYFPWAYPGALLNRQTWTDTYIGDVATAMGGIYATIVGTTEGGTTIEDHVNVSYYSGFTVVNPGGGKRAKNVPTVRSSPLVNAITGAVVLNRPGSQRRRNRS